MSEIEGLCKALDRAVELLKATKDFILVNDLEVYTVFYDGTICDGCCLATDCEAAVEDARDYIKKYNENE